MSVRHALPLFALFALACQEAQDVSSPDAPPVLSLEMESRSLTELAAQSLELAPTWVQADMALSLRRLEAPLQDELAQLMLDLDEPWLLDEVAFTIAHLSTEVLQDPDFYPQLIVENAQWVYRVDPELSYVDIVEIGEAGVDADFASTTSYWMEVDGERVQHSIEPELYYWYVVHQRIEDERPYYTRPWTACSSNTLQCAASPEEGVFWRGFLWEGAAETCPEDNYCPVLSDVLPQVDSLWNQAGGSAAEGAIGEVVRYMLDRREEDSVRWLSFGAHGERSIQPNRIYGLGRGNCGEWSDMTTAISRTALVPNVNVNPSSWDHTWNAFWDDGWVAWEPVNFWVDHPYGIRYAAYGTRGDNLSVQHTANYTEETFEMQVSVADNSGQPVDGAMVAIYSPFEQDGNTYWWPAGEAASGLDGLAVFTIGSDAAYTLQVDSVVGNNPVEDNYLAWGSDGVATGGTDLVEIVIDTELALGVPGLELIEPSGGDALITATLDDLEGRLMSRSTRLGDSSTQVSDAPTVELLLLDVEAHQAMRAGEPFQAVDLSQGPVAVELSKRMLVVAVNAGAVSTAAFGTLNLSVEPADGANFVDSASLQRAVQLMPQDFVSLRIEP